MALLIFKWKGLENMKKTLSVVLSLVMILSIIAMIPFTVTATELTGDGSKDNPYLISDYAGLKAFAEKVNDGQTGANAKLTGNIVADDAEWTPIGNGSGAGDSIIKYTGTFDGDGHKITGLTTPENYGDSAGLFGYVGEGGVIKNVGLEGGSINGSYKVGGIVGRSFGTVQNCYNTGTVNGVDYVGGIVGYNYSNGNGTAEVTNCYNTGAVTGTGNYDYVGGIVGNNHASGGGTVEVTNCYNTGTVTGTGNYANVGGIVGSNYAPGGTANVTNCYNTGAVTGTADYAEVGGIVGNNYAPGGTANVTNCYNTGAVTGTGSNAKVGGIVGYNYAPGGGTAKVANCYYDRNVVTVPGATSENNWNAIGENKGDTTVTNVKGLTTAEMTGTGALTNMGFSDTSVWLVKENTDFYTFYPHLKGFEYDNSGSNSDWASRKLKANAMEISNYAELKAFANEVNNNGRTDLNAILTADIVADDEAWTPIGNITNYYEGIFDGDGHKIIGLTTPSDYGGYAGLFNRVAEGGVIQNVGLEGGKIKGNEYVGGIAGLNFGTIQNCYNTSDVNGGEINVGGIVGQSFGTVQNCYNTATVKGESCVGGIVGENWNGTVKNCYNLGKVNGKDNVGGIAGNNDCTETDKKSNIINCYNTGAVTATVGSAYVGGIVGWNNALSDGTINNVINCYNIGQVTSTYNSSYVGGIIGYNKCNSGGKINVTNCCFDNFGFNTAMAIGIAEGNATVTNVKGLTVAEMTGTDALSNMGFSDTSVWLVKADGNDDADGKYYWFYPHLKGFDFNDSGEQETADNITPADWNAKAEVEVTWTEPESYICNDTELAPTVSSLTAGVTDLTAGTDYSLSFWKCTDTSGETVSEAIWPSDYKAVVSFTVSGHADIEKEFTITPVSPEITVTATEYVKVGKDVTITLNYPSDAYVVSNESAHGSVTFRIDGSEYGTIWGENGVAVFCLPTDASFIGEHTVEGIFNGDTRKYTSNSDTATFTVVSGSYKITFKNFDGTELQSGDVEYGKTPEYTGATPEKPADAQYTYTFAGWDKEIEAVTGEATYTATFTPTLRSYTVSFVNYDGTVLQSEVLDYGETPSYTGEIPARETDDSYIYEFDKWDKDIEAVTGETTYTATFKEIAVVPFPDVNKEDWFFDAAQYCARNGLITGYANGYFGPADSLQRQDFVVILARAAGADLSKYTSCTLPDVDMNSYYGRAVAWAVDRGIIKGYENGKFGVGDMITREQVVTILYRYLGSPATGDESALDSFTDADKTSAFAKEAMIWSVNNGIITGKDDETLAPTDTQSRAEIATVVMRMDNAGMFD
jgi:hypothetical protein